ncbi:MAG TPA: helix-turn-helix transcriptional regulator [Gaiellaceae bacterium]|nr:helix-turn-helix transcriptional regulator [Gaiellaceae bacterium]
MTSGMIIREARLRAKLSQGELAARVGRDRAQIARWETDAVQPAFETLLELVHACGFELDFLLVPRKPDAAKDARLRRDLLRSPQQRVQSLLRALKD